MPDQLTDDELERELRWIAEALMADAPAAPDELPKGPTVVRLTTAPRLPRRRTVLALAAALVLLLGAIGVREALLREDNPDTNPPPTRLRIPPRPSERNA